MPVAISSAMALSGFSPWDRGFIAWERGLTTAPSPGDPRYTVSFFLDGHKIFVLTYVPAPKGAPGLLYFPGAGDPAYQLNEGTITGASTDRWDPNGRWQYATAAWDAALRGALSAHGAALPGPDASSRPKAAELSRLIGRVPSRNVPGVPIWGIVPAAICLLGSVAWALRHRRHAPVG